MNSKSLNQRTAASLMLKLIEQFLSLGMSLFISIIVARLLEPKDYSIFAIMGVFYALGNVFIETGLSSAIVQKTSIEDKDVNTVFTISSIISVFIYFLIFFIAPVISGIYNVPELTLLLRVYGTPILFGAFTSVYNALVSRKLKYQFQLVSTIISTIFSGTLGIVAAYKGLGVWALVFQFLLQKFIYTALLVILTKKRIKLYVSMEALKYSFSFGWKIMMTNFIATLYGQVRNLIIGKQYDADLLGLYNKGCQYPNTIGTAINYSIQSVMLSAYSKSQENISELQGMVRRSIKMTSYFLFPVMIGLIAIAEPLVEILLTDKWLGAVPFLQITCVLYCLIPISSASTQAINALGKTDLSLKVEIVKRTFATIMLITGILIKNVYFLAWTSVGVELVGLIVSLFLNKKYLYYEIKTQLCDIAPILLLSMVMGSMIYCIPFAKLSTLTALIIQICMGIIVYFFGSIVFKLEAFYYLLGKIGIGRERNKRA